MSDLHQTTEELIAGLNARFGDDYEFTATAGTRWDKVVSRPVLGAGGSVHAFVDRSTGAIHKAAGQKAAPGPRYACAEAALTVADPYGGYLYVR